MSVLVGYGSSDEDDDEVGGQSATGLPPEVQIHKLLTLHLL